MKSKKINILFLALIGIVMFSIHCKDDDKKAEDGSKGMSYDDLKKALDAAKANDKKATAFFSHASIKSLTNASEFNDAAKQKSFLTTFTMLMEDHKKEMLADAMKEFAMYAKMYKDIKVTAVAANNDKFHTNVDSLAKRYDATVVNMASMDDAPKHKLLKTAITTALVDANYKIGDMKISEIKDDDADGRKKLRMIGKNILMLTVNAAKDALLADDAMGLKKLELIKEVVDVLTDNAKAMEIEKAINDAK